MVGEIIMQVSTDNVNSGINNQDKENFWIFFDYSGTLVDTIEALVTAYTRYLKRDFTHMEVKNLYKDYPVTNKLKMMIKYKINPIRFLLGGKKVFEQYRQEEFKEKVKVFPGIADVLNNLSQKPQINIAIVTHQTELDDKIAREKILKHYGVPNVFSAVITDYYNKEKSFIEFIEKNQIKYGLFIGDTQFDVDIGKKQNFETIGVTWGFSTKQELNANYVVSDPRELLKVIIGWQHQIEQKILHGDPI